MDQSFLFLSLVQFVVLLLSLTIHECAHAWTADRLGDPTARYLGRVSLNPMVHADLWGTIIFPLVGLQFGIMFGWAKPVPVNIGRLRNPSKGHMIVAAAGPVSNLLMAAIMFGVLMVMKGSSVELADLIRSVIRHPGVLQGGSIVTPLTLFAFYGMVINLILAIFNLIPVAPLDGAAVLAGLLPRGLAVGLDRMQSYSFLIFFVLLVTGIPQYLFDPPLTFLKRVLGAF